MLCVISIHMNSIFRKGKSPMHLGAGSGMMRPYCPCQLRVATTVQGRSSRRGQGQERGDDEPYIRELEVSTDASEDLWETKPQWCQPWTILVTGASGISLSWLLFNSIIFTIMTSAAVLAWWYLFLILVPSSYASAVRQMKEE